MTPSALNALLRLARRTVRRSLWRSTLVVALIALPVAGMVGAGALADSSQPSPDEAATNLMGRADLLLSSSEPSSAADLDRLAGWLPQGSAIEAIRASVDELVLDGLRLNVSLRGEDLDGLAAGRLTLLEGRAPAAVDEVAVSPDVASLAGVEMGDRLRLEALGEVRVVGIAVNPERTDERVVLTLPPDASGEYGDALYLVQLPPGAVLDPDDPNIRVDSFGTDAAFTGTSRAAVMPFGETTRLALIIVGGLAMVEAALVASAAFAVGLRRRLREFGLLSAAGAGPRHLAGSVVAEGLVLGGIGAAVGIVVGVAALLAAGPWLPDLTNRLEATPSFDPAWLLACGLIGIGAAIVAAAWPAFTAARIPVLAALSGRRPPARPATHGLAAGIGLLIAGGGLTLGAALMRRADGSDLSIYLLLIGAVLGVLGCGAMSPWFVERISLLAPRLPLSPRIALRDAGRARNRSGPIVTAVLASLAATVALATLITSQEAMSRQAFEAEMGERHLTVNGPGAELAGPRIAESLGAVASAPLRQALPAGGFSVSVTTDGVVGDEPLMAWNMVVGDWSLAEALEVPDTHADAFDAGTILVLTPHDVAISRATVTFWGEDGPIGERELPAVTVPIERNYPALPDAIIGWEAAEALGVAETDVSANRYLITLADPVTDAEVSAAASVAAEYPDTQVLAADPAAGAQDGLRTLVLVASVVVALTVTGVAVALGEAEARADHRTLVTVGAHPSLRRRITAARAGVIAAVGGLLAVPAGLLPVWGVLLSRGVPIVIPGPEILIAVVGLPVLAVLGGLLLSPSLPAYAERHAV
jgi:putative ABC transport system permease protein